MQYCDKNTIKTWQIYILGKYVSGIKMIVSLKNEIGFFVV